MLRRMASFFGNSQFAMDTHRKRSIIGYIISGRIALSSIIYNKYVSVDLL